MGWLLLENSRKNQTALETLGGLQKQQYNDMAIQQFIKKKPELPNPEFTRVYEKKENKSFSLQTG